jgi:hypothetical protein
MNSDAPKRARKRPQSRSKPADIARWERDYECVKMRRAEVDWMTIAEKLGYASPGHAHDRFLAFMRAYPRDDVEAMRDLELDRIEKTARALEPRIEQGDVRAAEVWNKLSERRAKLMGLDKPERREVTVMTEDALDKAIREAREEMERKARSAQEAGIELPALAD